MTDIAKCEGKDCPIRRYCYRYVARSDDRQTWLSVVPMDFETGECALYWDVRGGV